MQAQVWVGHTWPSDQPSEGCSDHHGPRAGPGLHLLPGGVHVPPRSLPLTALVGVSHPHQGLPGPLGDGGHPRPGKGSQPGSKQKAPMSQGSKRQEGPRRRQAGRDRLGLHHAALGFEKDQNGAKQIFIKRKPLLWLLGFERS